MGHTQAWADCVGLCASALRWKLSGQILRKIGLLVVQIQNVIFPKMGLL